MRRILPYVAVLAVYVMTPSAGEIVENVLHLLTTGHTAHAILDDAHRPNDPEHGCSGPFHVCSCHSSATFTAPAAGAAVGASAATTRKWGRLRQAAPSAAFLAGVFRPPIV